MKALILRSDAHASVETARALIDKGFQILSVDTQAVAHALIRLDAIDLLVMDERVDGQLTHAIALSAERKNPYLSAILLTDRSAEDTEDLYDLIPSLYGLVGSHTAPDLLGKLAVSAVSSIETALARVAQNAAVEEAELADTPDKDPLILAKAEMLSGDDAPALDMPSYADVAIAEPALAEIAAANHASAPTDADSCDIAGRPNMEEAFMLEIREDAVSAEVAALFRKHPLLRHVQPPQTFVASAG